MIFTSKFLCFCFILVITPMLYSQEIKDDKPEVNIGGALRFNYNLSSWKDGQKKRGGDFGYDFFRINAKAKYKGVKLNAEYRFYPKSFGGGMLKQGWLGYDFTPLNNLQIGLTQVPFGITQYNSHSWFFGINYYLGLEDDHDMGVKFSHKGEVWEYSLAFFKNAEELNFGSNSDSSDSRYSYDIGSIDLDGDGILDIRNKEVNQFNGKINYLFGKGNILQKFGISAEYGGLYNLTTENMGNHYAMALHYVLDVNQFNVKAQYTKYKFNPRNPEGIDDAVVAVTAYGAPYLIASKAETYTFGLAYTIPVKWYPISSIQIYNDFGYVDKSESQFQDTFMNVTGALITAGNVYTYVDFAAGKNQPWLGPVWTDALAQGTPDANWEMRFNINVGYYF